MGSSNEGCREGESDIRDGDGYWFPLGNMSFVYEKLPVKRKKQYPTIERKASSNRLKLD